jgi:hypothetical protein
MKTYVGVKIVQAEPAQRDGVDGYRVIYPSESSQEQGYESWCPKEVFEAHNRPTRDLPFSFALEAARQGKKITREKWFCRGQFVYFQQGYIMKRDNACNKPLFQWMVKKGIEEIEIVGHFDIKTPDGNIQYGWVPLQEDIIADDWSILE